jgi:hypothetical protein
MIAGDLSGLKHLTIGSNIMWFWIAIGSPWLASFLIFALSLILPPFRRLIRRILIGT